MNGLLPLLRLAGREGVELQMTAIGSKRRYCPEHRRDAREEYFTYLRFKKTSNLQNLLDVQELLKNHR